ncbi:MAG: 1-deoxy-D-xylulose-5-phosphate synthase [Oscillospiraceae bacterium]
MTLLDTINSREALCALNDAQLRQLCDEIRQFLVLNVARTGGHLASNLGVVELSVALERVFDTSRDRLLFDVGHQSYVHKILTGRRDEFRTLRMFGGLAGFPKPSESVTDPFVAGHASSSVSTALGMARARTLQHEDYHVVALMGDGAMTGGLAYEAMNDAGESSEQLIVILNDNGMSITPNVGGIAQHLALIRTRPGYYRIKKAYRAVTAKVPGGKCLYRLTHRLKEHWKRMLFGTTFFEEMGFEYYGPVDGHDLKRLEYMLRLVKDRRHPVLLHVITQKGKGYAPAEENPDVFHGIGHFDPEKGMEPRCGHLPTFSDTFSETIDALGAQEPRICAITAAMLRGTGLDAFAAHYPERCFDVGIAEGHAVSMAGGLAKQGMIPVVAIYSTFLQRAYDMLLQDVAMLGLHVVFAVDRAGLVGGDGETHHGVFDVNYLRSVPGMQVLCPASQAELGQMLRRAVLEMTGPVAVRYPRGCDGTFTGIAEQPCLREGSDITLVTYGTLVNEVLAAAKMLQARGISAEVLKLPSIKPLDVRTVAASMRKTGRLLVAEESVCIGCVGKELLASLRARGVGGPVRLCNLGDRFIPHGAVPELYRLAGLDAKSLADAAWEVCRMKHKERLDVVLVERGLCDSRSKAQALIMSGEVYVNGQKSDKAGTPVEDEAVVELRGNPCPYVSRGGLKLEKALRDFGVDPTGFVCSDSGASTGGFTDCLLQKGAKKVFAIDVGYGQLAWSIRQDPRVVCMERTNIRYVTPEQLGEPLDLSVVDVSFISLRIVLPAIRALLKPTGQILCLIKPQFEAGREKVGKKGVVRDPAVHEEVLQNFLALAAELELTVRNLTFSPVRGPEGNIEFLGHLSMEPQGGITPDVPALVAQAHAELRG